MPAPERLTKSQIADLLDEIGTLLELRGENKFKCIAFHNASRTIAAGTPVIDSVASGACRGSATNARHFRYDSTSHRSCTNASRVSPSVTTTCASALMIATLVQGRSCRWTCVACSGISGAFWDPLWVVTPSSMP